MIVLALGVAVLAAGVLLWRRGRKRTPTRATADMDHDVRERIRHIAAESRYSSAGIEF